MSIRQITIVPNSKIFRKNEVILPNKSKRKEREYMFGIICKEFRKFADEWRWINMLLILCILYYKKSLPFLRASQTSFDGAPPRHATRLSQTKCFFNHTIRVLSKTNFLVGILINDSFFVKFRQNDILIQWKK